MGVTIMQVGRGSSAACVEIETQESYSIREKRK
jgi:hypothetical protein